jgi:N-methylhydantoinase A
MSAARSAAGLSVSADVGGTFTDVVALGGAGGGLVVGKRPTLAESPVEGIIGALAGAGVEIADIDRFFHGTTLGINALLERRGAKVGFVTTHGFRDILAIGRGDWPLYRLTWKRKPALVPRRLTREVDERIAGDGSVSVPLEPDQLDVAADELVAAGVEAIAVCFLNSYLNPEHELAAGRAISERHPELDVTLSHEIGRRFGEFPRAATAVGEAYLRPALRRYFDRLGAGMREREFDGTIFITSSDGGVMSIDHACDRVLRTLVSGCASGVAGAAVVAQAAGWRNLLAIDMGGTSFDAAVIRDGQPEMSTVAQVADQEFLMPMLDLATIGAGGGSIAHVDAVGALHVGPRSAGANPGPACYERGGTLPTVTDAALVAGLLPETLISGAMALSSSAAGDAIEREVGRPLGLSVAAAAQGVLTVIEARMGRLLHELTVGKGLDPREFTLFAYGGGGPLVAAHLAEELGIARLVVPVHAGVFSAWGMQTLDIVHEVSRTSLRMLESDEEPSLEAPFVPLIEQVEGWLRGDGFDSSEIVLLRFLEMRYDSQEHTLLVPFVPDGAHAMRAAFDAAHRGAFGFTVDGQVEIVNYRVRAIGRLPKADPGGYEQHRRRASPPVNRGVWEPNAQERAAWRVRQRDTIGVEDRLEGPAIVEEATATTVVPAGWTLELHPHGHLVMTR